MPRSAQRPQEPADLPYTEIAPPADLARCVDRFWLRRVGRVDPARTQRVLPDGCVDVIVHADRGAAMVVGTMTHALELPEGPAEMIAVRFKPGAAGAITRCALAELTDREASVADLGIAPAAVVDPVLAATTPHARVAALVGWVRARLGARLPDRMVGRAVALLSRHEARVDDVADDLGVTRQHLARTFRREVGITPKELVRIARVQRAAAAIGRGGVELAQLAVALGYFDQSHLAHDVRALTGTTPAALVAAPAMALTHLFDR